MNESFKAEVVLKSNCIFTATASKPIQGYVAVAGGKGILAVDSEGAEAYIGPDTIVYELGDRMICPGFVDVHCFFTGYVLGFVGVDLTAAGSAKRGC